MTCKLTIQNRQAQVEVVPTAAALIIKALKEPVIDRKAVKGGMDSSLRVFCLTFLVSHDGDVTMEQIYEAARVMRPKSFARTFTGTVKEVWNQNW